MPFAAVVYIVLMVLCYISPTFRIVASFMAWLLFAVTGGSFLYCAIGFLVEFAEYSLIVHAGFIMVAGFFWYKLIMSDG